MLVPSLSRSALALTVESLLNEVTLSIALYKSAEGRKTLLPVSRDAASRLANANVGQALYVSGDVLLTEGRKESVFFVGSLDNWCHSGINV